MWDEPNVVLRSVTIDKLHHKKCWFVLTAGRWSWKSTSAKECVTTHLPNRPALKMDRAKSIVLYSTALVIIKTE